jgi:hypothetical protein
MFFNRLYELSNQQDGKTKASCLINQGNNKTKAQEGIALFSLYFSFSL